MILQPRPPTRASKGFCHVRASIPEDGDLNRPGQYRGYRRPPGIILAIIWEYAFNAPASACGRDSTSVNIRDMLVVESLSRRYQVEVHMPIEQGIIGEGRATATAPTIGPVYAPHQPVVRRYWAQALSPISTSTAGTERPAGPWARYLPGGCRSKPDIDMEDLTLNG